MEKKLKSVRGNNIFVIVIFLFSTIFSFKKNMDVNQVISLSFSILYLISFIFCYIRYKTDILIASNVQIVISIIMILVTIINLICNYIIINQLVNISIIYYLPTILMLIVPVVLLCDAISIKKYLKNN
ncbi:MAG: hypothetical protein RSE41_01455 [Clostridia bacterium]